MPEPLLDASAIRALLLEVAEELEGERVEIVIVGGALLALNGLREATRDVDTVCAIDVRLEAAVARVAERHDLTPKWLNDRSRPFLPATFEMDDCEILLDHPKLLVLGASMDQVFLMKVHAGRAADADDLEALWPRCSFARPTRPPLPTERRTHTSRSARTWPTGSRASYSPRSAHVERLRAVSSCAPRKSSTRSPRATALYAAR